MVKSVRGGLNRPSRRSVLEWIQGYGRGERSTTRKCEYEYVPKDTRLKVFGMTRRAGLPCGIGLRDGGSNPPAVTIWSVSEVVQHVALSRLRRSVRIWHRLLRSSVTVKRGAHNPKTVIACRGSNPRAAEHSVSYLHVVVFG